MCSAIAFIIRTMAAILSRDMLSSAWQAETS